MTFFKYRLLFKKMTVKQIFHKTLVGVAYIYYYLKHFFTYKDYQDKIHIDFFLRGFLLEVKVQSHLVYVLEMMERLQEARSKMSVDQFLLFAITETRRCNYIFFYVKNDDKFVQFWLGDGKLILDWPTESKHHSEMNLLAMLGILNLHGIQMLQIHEIKPKRLPYAYIEVKGGKERYKVDFNKYPSEAVVVIKDIFKHIFKVKKLDRIDFRIG